MHGKNGTLAGEWKDRLKLILETILSHLLTTTRALRLSTPVARRFQLGNGNGGVGMLRRRERASYLVLTFHRVSDDPHPYFEGVPVGVFRKQMTLLRRFFQVLPLSELVERATSDDVPPNAVAITFDDGYRDNYANAYPVLAELGLPATIFLVTDAVDSNAPIWHDVVFEAFRLTRVENAVFQGDTLPLRSPEDKGHALSRFLTRVRRLSPAERDAAIDHLQRALHVEVSSESCLPKLTWTDVRCMQENGIEFGAHTVDHPLLSRMDIDAAASQVRTSKSIIEERLGTSVRLFAYPNGKPEDFNQDVKDVVRESGFSGAVTTVWGANDSRTDPYELRRVSGADDGAELAAVRLRWFQLLS